MASSFSLLSFQFFHNLRICPDTDFQYCICQFPLKLLPQCLDLSQQSHHLMLL